MNYRQQDNQLPAMVILACGVGAVAAAFVISIGGFAQTISSIVGAF